MLLQGISEFKPSLEKEFSSSLKAAVSITSISGEFSGLNPSIRISGLTIADPDGGSTSRIESIIAVVDSLACLRNLTFSLGRLEVRGIRTALERLESGGWKVAGLPKWDTATDPTPIVDFFANIDSLTFSDIEVDLQTPNNNFHLYLPEDKNVELSTRKGLRRITATLNYTADKLKSLPHEVGTIELVGEFSGNPLNDDEFYSSVYLQVSPIPLPELLPAVHINDLSLSALSVGGSFWLEVDKGEVLLQGELTAPVVSFSKDKDRREVVTDLQALFRLEGFGLWDWRLTAEEIRFSQDGKDRNVDNIKVASFINNRKRTLVGSFGRLDIGSILGGLLKLSANSSLLTERTRTMLETMRPEGLLENVHFKLLMDEEPIDARLVAGISNVKTRAYLGSPAISSLNGIISAGPKNGWLDIHNENFTVRFEHAFKDDWHFDSASGRLKYDYVPGLIKLSSDLLKLSEKGMVVNGAFHMNLPRDRSAQTWGLVVGITDADLSEKRRYLPFTISDGAYEWLDRAVVAGHAIDGGLMLHGTLSREAPTMERSYELYFNVQDSILDYHPSWPRVSDMVGKVYLGNWGAEATDMVAKIYSSQVTTAHVTVPFDLDGKISVVEVVGKLTGSASDAVRFLSETPLKDQVNHLADDWVAKGDISVTADLVIPIAEIEQESTSGPTDAESTIVIVMDGNELLMPSYDIHLQNIKGELTYSDQEGLNSQAYTAQLFGGEIYGKISTVTGETGEVTISANGNTTVEDLYLWSEQTILTRASGEFDYSAELKIPFGNHLDSSSLEARSVLAGVTVDLPPPLGKTADETREFRYLNTFGDSVQRVEVDYGEHFSAALTLEDAKVIGGWINFGEQKVQVPQTSGVVVKGYLAEVDLAQWQSLSDDLQSKYMALSDVSLEAEMSRSIELIYLDIGKLHAFGGELIDVRSQMRRSEQQWVIDIVNPILGGRIMLPDDSDKPLIVDLDYIRIEANEDKGDAEDPLLQLNPKQLGGLIFSTDEFFWNGEDYGSWSFVFSPTENGGLISNLSASVKGLNIGTPSNTQKQPWITWTKTEQGHRSHFEGLVYSNDLAKVLQEWGFASSIESGDVKFNAQLDWLGSPAMFSYETVTGAVDLDAEEGRFVQAQPGSGALRMLGVFDFASIARRFRFDFSDIVDSGFPFDEIKGIVFLENGVIKVIEPIEIDSPSSTLKVGGEVNLLTKEVDGDMIVTLPVSRNLPWFAAIASGPLFGAGVFLAQKILLDEPIKQFSSAKYRISGSIDEPVIEFISIFDNSVRQREEVAAEKVESTDSK